MKKPRFFLVGIVLLTAVAILIDWPTIPIRFNVGPLKIDKVLAGPSLDLNIFGYNLQRDFNVKLGLDLQGGTNLTLRADMSDVPASERNNALDATKAVIERRINLFGVSEPVIETSKVGNDYRIIVQLPGIKNVDAAKSLIGQTAKLEFRKFRQDKDATSFASTGLPQPTLVNTEPTGITGKDLQSANASLSTSGNQTTSAPVVDFEIKSGSADKFGQVTQSLLQKPLIVFLDDSYVSAPTVQSQITSRGQITFPPQASINQAKTLATQLNAGALPVKKIEIISEQTVGATLGQDSVNKSLFAGIVGLIVIGVFMVYFYGVPGILADGALLLYTLFTLAIFKAIPVTLTLAGIAGFILSIGMAVDANILIFERMKEELRLGRLRKQAIEIGFSRAWNSIRDSNFSSLITTVILFQFGTGSVRGFAITLAIGILVSMFTAIVVTRNLLRLVYKE